MVAPRPGRVAILGAGLIGIDLLTKLQHSAHLDCALVVGHNAQTRGLRRAVELGCATAAGGIDALLAAGVPVDIVFDASNADCHAEHWARLAPTGSILIDLTPAQLGVPVLPTINGTAALAHRHVSLISCGGQATIPILHAIAQCAPIDYIEVVCTAASASVGRATRLNLDHYIHTTQAAIRTFTDTHDVKVMVNVSPAHPAPPFRVAMTMLTSATRAECDRIDHAIALAASQVQAFAPGFEITSCSVTAGRIAVVAEVRAQGGRLPTHAGNLDIINAAAVLLAQQYATAPSRLRGIA